jgi:hypothetical protein
MFMSGLLLPISNYFFYELCQKRKEKKKLRKSHKIIHNLHKKIQHKTKVADLLKQTFLMI